MHPKTALEHAFDFTLSIVALVMLVKLFGRLDDVAARKAKAPASSPRVEREPESERLAA